MISVNKFIKTFVLCDFNFNFQDPRKTCRSTEDELSNSIPDYLDQYQIKCMLNRGNIDKEILDDLLKALCKNHG